MGRVTLLGVIISLLLASVLMTTADAHQAVPAKVEQAFSKLPLYFIENQGQIDCDDVAYYVKGADKTLYFKRDGVTFLLRNKKERWAVKLGFLGANRDVVIRGEDKQEAVFSYFKGKPENWKTGLPTYGKIVYEDLWPGIDLVYSGTVNRLKYEFVVHPGASPGAIRLAYGGITAASVGDAGRLKITTPAGSFEDGVPYAYQEAGRKKEEVAMRYRLAAQGSMDRIAYGFEVGEYDRLRPLILDPSMFLYCGYIGGSDGEWGHGIAVDSQGNAYVTGWTLCDETSFPVVVGPDLTFNGNRDTFVAKIAAFDGIFTDIKANGSDGPLTIPQGSNLSLQIWLDPGQFSGKLSDWWILAHASNGWFHYSINPPAWLPGISVTRQGPLTTLQGKVVFTSRFLPKGTYRFVFGVDINMNGLINLPLGYSDLVTVEVR